MSALSAGEKRRPKIRDFVCFFKRFWYFDNMLYQHQIMTN